MKIMVIVGLVVIAITLLADDIGGIGLVIINRKTAGEPLRIGNIVQGSPAEEAGIKSRYYLISVDSTNIVGMSLPQAISMIRGGAGTTVTLELADPTMSQTNRFTLKRVKMVFSQDRVEIVAPELPR